MVRKDKTKSNTACANSSESKREKRTNIENTKTNAETSDLNPSVMCTSRSGNRYSLYSPFLLCSKYCVSYATKLERKANTLQEM